MGRREENNRRTKEAIVSNALRLFRERGFDAVTVEEITRASGVAKGTFYTHFAVKSDIIVEEFRKIDRYYATYAERNLRRYATAEEKLRAFTRAQMRYVRDEVGNDSLKILYVNQTLAPGADKVILDRDRRWYSIVAGVIAEGQAEGRFRTDVGAVQLAEGFNRSMRSVFLDWCITDAGFDLAREALAYLETWLLPALRAGVSEPVGSREAVER